MSILTPEFLQLVQWVVVIAIGVGSYKGAVWRTMRESEKSRDRSLKNSNSIESVRTDTEKKIEILSRDLKNTRDELQATRSLLEEERQAAAAARAAIQSWEAKYAASDQRIHILEKQIISQEAEIKDLTTENIALKQQVEAQVKLREAMEQRMDAEDTAMEKALAAVNQIITPILSPLIQLAMARLDDDQKKELVKSQQQPKVRRATG